MGVLKHAFRTLFKTPFLTGVAVLSLALGIGANAAIFSLFDQMLMRALPVEAPEELVNLAAPGPMPGSTSCGQSGGCDEIFSYAMFRDLQQADVGLSGLVAHRDIGVNLSMSQRTVSGSGLLVSGSYFPVLGVQPAMGRLLGPADDENIGEHYVAVLSHDFWENELGADRSVLNQTLVVNGQPMTVVGVAPRGFKGVTLGQSPDVFLPITMRQVLSPTWSGFENRRVYWIYLFGRLEPGVTLEQAGDRINSVFSGILDEVEVPLQEGMSEQTLERFRAKQVLLSEGYRGQSTLHGEARTPLILLFSITGLVLLIACANVANLLLARGAQRGVEMAVRGSLGAQRSQLLRQLLTESLLLAVLGGAASLLVARWTLDVIGSMLPPEAVDGLVLELQPSVLVFTTVVAVATGILFGLFPALHSTRPDLVTVIKGSTGQPSGSRAAHRFRNGLVTAQIALSMTLLVVAGLFIKSLVNVSRVDLGLSTENLVTFSVAPVLNGYEPERSAALFQRIEEEVAAIPGVAQVSSSMVPVLAGNSWGNSVRVEGFPNDDPDIDRNSRYNEVGPAYLSAMDMALVAGREFTASDGLGAPPVAIVNEAFTRKFNLNGREAVGKYMSTGGEGDLDVEIVGVVADTKYNDVRDPAPPLFFRPYKQNDELGFLTFYVRTAGDPTPVLRAIPETMRRLDPNLPVDDLRRMEDQVRQNLFLDRMISTLAAAFAVLATVLAAVGLYGVLAYTVAQRTREIGLRMALGAGQDRIRSLVLRQVSVMLVLGGALGAVAAVGLGGLAQSLLFGLDGMDAVVMGASVLLLGAVAYGAGYLPARRAARVDPMEALRYE
ncbi:MAG TPA: ABC transporter permease [Longimicrobiales bacterium]|nr:ABC transporter permease [Longimicrobiales bacterium]